MTLAMVRMMSATRADLIKESRLYASMLERAAMVVCLLRRLIVWFSAFF
jgi:hypothetical protein